MTIYNDTLNWSDITPICELITELDFNTDFDLITEFWSFHRTLQRVRLANRGRLLLRTPGPCICSYVETILSWTCHIYEPFEFRTSLGKSILLRYEFSIDYTFLNNVHVRYYNNPSRESFVIIIHPSFLHHLFSSPPFLPISPSSRPSYPLPPVITPTSFTVRPLFNRWIRKCENIMPDEGRRRTDGR